MNTSAFSSVLNLDAHLVWRWYRDHLSGFVECKDSGEHNQHDLHISENRTVRIPIYKPDNFGKHMSIDEKQIGEDMHTILSNRETGKIALLVESLRFQDLRQALEKEEVLCGSVETLTRDLSPTYAKVGNELFFNSSPVADKFHIIKSLLESSQDVRVRLRQEQLRDRRIKYSEHKTRERERKKECQNNGAKYKSQPFRYEEETLSNGETVLEALARSRYLLFKYPDDMTPKQRKRAKALFEKYPEIYKSYNRSCEFRNWMKKENVEKNIRELKDKLNDWSTKVEKDDIDEMLNFKSLVERNILPIMNYFRFGATNAMAENINSRIQRFVTINQGTRDREFFYFRMRNYFS